jgi:hypothetical protein
MVTGSWNVAPWQPLLELELMETALGTSRVVVPVGTVMVNPVSALSETTVVVQLECPESGVAGEFKVMLVRVKEYELGFTIFSNRSPAVLPG